MSEKVNVLYITDWEINGTHTSKQDPFAHYLDNLDANIDIVHELPESFEETDLLILHPKKMNDAVFETISRSKSHNPSVKTMVISSAHASDLFLHAIDIGIDKYLLKPLSASAFLKVAERLVDHSLEEKQAKKAFDHVNLMFGAVAKTSLLARMGEKGIIKEVNPLVSKLLGYSSEDIIGLHWFRFVERRFWDFLRLLVREKLKSGEIYRGTIEMVTSEGETVLVDATVYAIRKRKGEIDELVFIGQDVSERNRAILASMEQLIDHDTTLAVVYDHRYKAVLVNRKFLELGGHSDIRDFFASCDDCSWMCEAQGEPVSIVPNSATQKEALESIFSRLKTKQIGGRIVWSDHAHNTRYYTAHMSVMPNPMISNENYYILYFVDVTDLERLKEEKLTDAKLLTVGRLAAAITHEINTPITYIKGNLELLKLECEDHIPESMSLFEPVDEGIKRIESIVSSMYEFAGSGKEEMKPCNLHMTLIYALRIVINRAKHIVPITINGEVFSNLSRYERDSCMTMGISTRLEQVWIIILNNALDEFEKGTIPYDERRLAIDFRCGEEQIRIRIRDNAGGIPESMIGGIFDFAVSGEKKKSMGIGLNVAKAVIDKHGGSIRVKNEDHGAVFEIVLKTYKEKE